MLSTDGTAHVHAYVADDDAQPRARRMRARAFAAAGIAAELAHARRRRGGLGRGVEGALPRRALRRAHRRRAVVAHVRRRCRATSCSRSIPAWRSAPASTRRRACASRRSSATSRPGTRVLDAGCGSGILAIAAAKLGAREVLRRRRRSELRARHARERGANGSSASCAPRQAASATRGRSRRPLRGFDVVVANIIARVIIELAQPLVDALAPLGPAHRLRRHRRARAGGARRARRGRRAHRDRARDGRLALHRGGARMSADSTSSPARSPPTRRRSKARSPIVSRRCCACARATRSCCSTAAARTCACAR